ncbi:hypothetical protein NDU88_003706 [Pleurodeles waltl]|uniref:Uncharacterized protein n=1 Tax=Pleurodeles waltl TaxID=8319 RepID=A0AAV7TPT7_PLEWA|nr:hypothetical protein NDU88_003706 [Pleurodeles waltl]
MPQYIPSLLAAGFRFRALGRACTRPRSLTVQMQWLEGDFVPHYRSSAPHLMFLLALGCGRYSDEQQGINEKKKYRPSLLDRTELSLVSRMGQATEPRPVRVGALRCTTHTEAGETRPRK